MKLLAKLFDALHADGFYLAGSVLFEFCSPFIRWHLDQFSFSWLFAKRINVHYG